MSYYERFQNRCANQKQSKTFQQICDDSQEILQIFKILNRPVPSKSKYENVSLLASNLCMIISNS